MVGATSSEGFLAVFWWCGVWPLHDTSHIVAYP